MELNKQAPTYDLNATKAQKSQTLHWLLARNACLGSRKLDEDLTGQVVQPETIFPVMLCEENLAVSLPFAFAGLSFVGRRERYEGL